MQLNEHFYSFTDMLILQMSWTVNESLWNIGILLHKQATLGKQFRPECNKTWFVKNTWDWHLSKRVQPKLARNYFKFSWLGNWQRWIDFSAHPCFTLGPDKIETSTPDQEEIWTWNYHKSGEKWSRNSYFEISPCRKKVSFVTKPLFFWGKNLPLYYSIGNFWQT